MNDFYCVKDYYARINVFKMNKKGNFILFDFLGKFKKLQKFFFIKTFQISTG